MVKPKYVHLLNFEFMDLKGFRVLVEVLIYLQP